MRLSIRHVTRYAYAFPVKHGLQRLRLKPKSSHGQKVLEWSMDFEGARAEAEYDDHNANGTTLVSVNPGVSDITITCEGVVDTVDNAGVLGPHVGFKPLWRFQGESRLARPGPKMRALASALGAHAGSDIERLHALSARILEEMRYETGRTDAATTGEEALTQGHGVCQDHAHVFIGAARLLGFPARYVSGYLLLDDMVDQHAGHAWAEAHVQGLGWVGFDVSNGISPDERYVRVATGRDYRDAAPITGLCVGAGETALEVSLAVEQRQIEQ